MGPQRAGDVDAPRMTDTLTPGAATPAAARPIRARGGRPKKMLADGQLQVIEGLAGFGVPMDMIAAAMGMDASTLRARAREFADVEAAVARGRAKVRAAVGKALLNKALQGDVGAIRWFEATRYGLSEKATHEHTGAGGAPIAHVVQVQFVSARGILSFPPSPDDEHD